MVPGTPGYIRILDRSHHLQQLHMEQGLISTLFTALRNILNLSPNLEFQKSYESQMKVCWLYAPHDSYSFCSQVLGMSISSSCVSAEDAISKYLGTAERLDMGGSQLMLHEDLAFTLAIERIYCFAMKRRTFKVTLSPFYATFSDASAERFFEKWGSLHGRRDLRPANHRSR